jgi:cytochrome c oxidase subunit 3
MHRAESMVGEPFDCLQHQEETATVGMWIFLSTEVIFFGGLFTAYTALRATYPHEFAVGSAHTNVLLGTLNTAVLLTSSFFMALAVQKAKAGERRSLVRYLLATIALALVFLALKGLEYSQHISEGFLPGRSFTKDVSPRVELFFWLYFVMTGLHALHVTIGVGVLSVICGMAEAGKFSRDYSNPVEIGGLYWHFVDLVWVFLYPLFYLIK